MIEKYLKGKLSLGGKDPISIQEGNTAYVTQFEEGYIKGHQVKHISPKYFLTYELQVKGVIKIEKIDSSNNPAEIFTKSLPIVVFVEYRYKIDIRRLIDLPS